MNHKIMKSQKESYSKHSEDNSSEKNSKNVLRMKERYSSKVSLSEPYDIQCGSNIIGVSGTQDSTCATGQ